MKINTTRFGSVEIRESDVLEFPQGMIGLEACRKWVVLSDAVNRGLGWLQSIERPEVAFAVVSPRRFVPGYRARVAARELEALGPDSQESPQVVVTLSRHTDGPMGEGLSLNLKAPIVVCLKTRRGRQVVAKDDHPVRHWLKRAEPLRRSA